MKRFLKHLRGLRVSYKINRTQMLMSMGIPILFGLFSGILISKRIYEPDKKALDSKFEEIYETLKESSEYIYNLSDTQIRVSHYAAPHTEFKDLCPECGDLWGKKKEGVVEIPTSRLAELREITGLYPPNNAGQHAHGQPVDLTVEEELDSILHLLKSTKSMLYSTMYAGEITYHNLSQKSPEPLHKHNHPRPGIIGGCPDCKKLRDRQTTILSYISKDEYSKLIKAEKDIKDGKTQRK